MHALTPRVRGSCGVYWLALARLAGFDVTPARPQQDSHDERHAERKDRAHQPRVLDDRGVPLGAAWDGHVRRPRGGPERGE